jgi:PadR family transcriptional regulator, regulatory protein AphA
MERCDRDPSPHQRTIYFIMKYMVEDSPAAPPGVKRGRRPLTTTSFAILGLLSVRPWPAYELTGQMKRGLRHTWPRTETRLYQEPKNLVAHGLATASTQVNGRRSRTVYSITPGGRRALARWLEAESAPPQMQSEAVLRATFADAGSKDALVATLRGLRAHGEALRRQLGDQAADYIATGGPFPERLHLIALIGRFLSDYAELLEGWAAWAEDTVAHWPATGPANAVPIPAEVFDLVLRRAGQTRPSPGDPQRPDSTSR